jgi:hypothetical protein
MDHPHADHLGLVNAVDVLQRPNLLRQRSSFWTRIITPGSGRLPLTFVLFGDAHRP